MILQAIFLAVRRSAVPANLALARTPERVLLFKNIKIRKIIATGIVAKKAGSLRKLGIGVDVKGTVTTFLDKSGFLQFV